MIYKRCSRCNKRIEEGTKCSCIKDRHKEYKRYRKDSKEQSFYTSKEWLLTRDKVKDKFNGLDIYSYYILGKIEYGYTVHHIEELKDNWDRRLDMSNLIYLTESNHRIIHKKMLEGNKKDIMNMLYNLLERYNKEFER